MGRSPAFVLAVVGLLTGLALIDHERDRGAGEGSLAATTAAVPPAGTAEAEVEAAAFGDTSYLLSCLGSAVSEAGDAPPSPPLTPRGVAAISRRIERLRELAYDGPVDVQLLTDAQVDRRISALIDRDYPASLARRQGLALELLGALPPESDLLELTETALSSQVIGLYVPETEELLVASSGKAGALEQITLAHELEHALAHDALGFPLPERARAGRSDRDLAAQALIEGDASLTMELYALRYIDLEEQLSLLDEPGAAVEERRLEELPHFLQRQLLFPYDAGLRYVCSRYEEGGWEAVDRAYADPPGSTAELLDPEGAPIELEKPPAGGALPRPWRRTLSDQIGAAELSWLLEAPGGDPAATLPEPRAAAAEWRGGSFTLWQDGPRSALGISLAAPPGGELCGAMIAWYGASRPEASLEVDGATSSFSDPGRAASITCDDAGVVIGIAPDPATAAALSG